LPRGVVAMQLGEQLRLLRLVEFLGFHGRAECFQALENAGSFFPRLGKAGPL
jgi:hypothetical protein